MPSDATQPRAWWAAPVQNELQHHLVERLAGIHRDPEDVAVDRRAGPGAGVGVDDLGGAQPGGGEHGGLGPPGGPQVDRRRWAGDVDLLDGEVEASVQRRAAAMPAVRATRTTPVPSARTAAASGGRFDRGGGVLPASHRTRTGRPCSSASRRATAGTGDAELAAEGAAVGQRRRRLAPRLAPRRVGLQVAGLAPSVVRRVTAQSPGPGGGHRPRRRRPSCAGPWTLPASGPALGQRLADAPNRRRRRRGRRANPGGAVSAAKPAAAAAATVGPDGCGVPPSIAGPASGRLGSRTPAHGSIGPPDFDGEPGVEDRLPAGAPAQVGERGPGARRPATRRCRRRAAASRMPGRAEPALGAAGGAQGVGPPAAGPVGQALHAW